MCPPEVEVPQPSSVPMVSAESELGVALDAFPDEVQDCFRGARARLRAQFPDAVQVVHVDGGTLTVEFGPDPVNAHAVLALVVTAHSVELHFLPDGGEPIELSAPEDLAEDSVVARLEEHLAATVVPMEASEKGDVIWEGDA